MLSTPAGMGFGRRSRPWLREPTTNREQSMLACFAEVRRRKSQRLNGRGPLATASGRDSTAGAYRAEAHACRECHINGKADRHIDSQPFVSRVEIPGFEPGQREPKSLVLPLHHTSIPVAKILFILFFCKESCSCLRTGRR